MDKLRVLGLYHCFRPINENWYLSKDHRVCLLVGPFHERAQLLTTLYTSVWIRLGGQFFVQLSLSLRLSPGGAASSRQFMSLPRRLSESGRVRFFKNKLHSVRRARAGWLIGHWSTSVGAGGDATVAVYATAVGEDTTGKLRHLSLSSWTSGLESTDQYYRQTDNARSLSRCKCGLSNGERGVLAVPESDTSQAAASQPTVLQSLFSLETVAICTLVVAVCRRRERDRHLPQQPPPWAANEKLPRDKHLRMKRLRNNCLLSSRSASSLAHSLTWSPAPVNQRKFWRSAGDTQEPNQHTSLACVVWNTWCGGWIYKQYFIFPGDPCETVSMSAFCFFEYWLNINWIIKLEKALANGKWLIIG